MRKSLFSRPSISPWLLVVIVVTLLCETGFAQTAVVNNNANLRQGPGTSFAVIRLLLPGESLTVLSLTPTTNYFNVGTQQGEAGWVYKNYIDIDEAVKTGVLDRNANLRQGPSSTNPVIRLLMKDETVQLLEAQATSNYYHVKTSAAEVGWTYAPYVTVTSTNPSPPVDTTTPFPDAHEAPIAGWTGPVFKLSQAYPTTAPTADPKPWKNFDFKTQSAQYMKAVIDYCKDGNISVDWVGQNNTVRKWYHVPWLHAGANGREFVHGLTRERSSRPRELHPNQTNTFSNYAVGLYNQTAGFVVGQVWKDHENPSLSAAKFPDGSVAVKLLFTMATVAQVPYMKNAFEWDAYVASSGSNTRSIQKVRLLQIDIGVRDTRADSTTGWVFGTFAYDGDAVGATPWDRMVPLGVMWGNDPTLTQAQYDGGARPQQTVILNRTIGISQHLGWLERLNGPVDNPQSSCLSCHSTAQYVAPAPLPPSSASSATRMRWFRNIKAGDPFDAGQESLDYSLQLSEGIKRFFQNRSAPIR